jgi:exopolysaccharide production protein ExoQ
VNKSSFVHPVHNTAYGIFAIVVSYFVFAYSIIFGAISILAFYAVWYWLIAVDYRPALFSLIRAPLVLALPVFCVLSFFWSVEPSVTLRSSVQFLTHVLCAFIAAQSLSARTFTLGSVIALSVVLGYSWVYGNYSYDVIDATYSFVGAFGSKNQLGLYASLGVYFSAVYALAFTKSLFIRILCLGLAIICGIALVSSQSATSIVATPLALLAFVASRMLQGLRLTFRWLVMSLTALLLTAGGIAFLSYGGMDVVLAAFGKDSSLTGRTYLWSEGLRLGSLFPNLGHGYNAFWVMGNSESERLWAEFYIDSRTGFHFHNTFIQAYVDLGWLGVVAISSIFLITLIRCIKSLMLNRSLTESSLLLGLSLMLLIRSMVEVDALYAYSIGSFLMFYAFVRSGAAYKVEDMASIRPSAAVTSQMYRKQQPAQ